MLNIKDVEKYLLSYVDANDTPQSVEGDVGLIVKTIKNIPANQNFSLQYKLAREAAYLTLEPKNWAHGEHAHPIYLQIQTALAERGHWMRDTSQNWQRTSMAKIIENVSTPQPLNEPSQQPEDKPTSKVETPAFWLTYSNLFFTGAVFSGALIYLLDEFYKNDTYSVSEAEIMLLGSAALLALTFLGMKGIQYFAPQTLQPNPGYPTTKCIYNVALVFAAVGALGLLASCAWTLTSGEWNNSFRFQDSQTERTFTALYGFLGGAAVVSTGFQAYENRQQWLNK